MVTFRYQARRISLSPSDDPDDKGEGLSLGNTRGGGGGGGEEDRLAS
jgi:hypothetical protein